MKTKIYEFDPVIYPRKLWITYEATNEELNKMFPYGDSDGRRFEDEKQYYGITYKTADKENKGGVLIRFESKDAMTPWNITHEVIHAAGFICKYVGIEPDFENDEAFTYLATWIAKCCCKVKDGDNQEKDTVEKMLERVRNAEDM